MPENRQGTFSVSDFDGGDSVSKQTLILSPLVKKTWTVGTLSYTTGGLAALFGWLLWGDFAWQVRDRAIPPIMQILFKKYDASDMLAGLLFSSLPLAIGLITGPFISYLSDRHRGPRGRRIPYMLFSTPFIVLSIIGLAFSPQLGAGACKMLGTHSPGMNASVLISLGLFWMIFEFACGVSNMIFGGLVNDVVPQLLVGRFFGLFRILSLVAGIIFNYWIIGGAEAHFAWIFLGVGILYGIGFTMMCLNVKEGGYPPPPEVTPSNAGPVARLLAAIRDYFKSGYSHSYYIWFFASFILAGVAVTPFNLYSVFYAKSLGVSMAAYGKCLTLTYIISLCLAYPLGSLADRFHPLRMTIVSLALYAVATGWAALHVCDARTYAIALVAQSVLCGCYFTVSASLWQRLLPREKFAQIGSAGGTINCLVGIGFAPALGMFLDYTRHNYRYTFHVGFCLAVLALIANIVLHRRFMMLGGPANYSAPE